MNFTNGMWVMGGGGIGLALMEKAKSENIEVSLFSRPEVDLTQLSHIQRFFAVNDHLPSVIVNTIGMLYNDNHSPEKSLIHFQADWFYESLRVNALPVIWMAQCLSKKLNKYHEFSFINLSARVSSVSDNHSGGWYSYRASKCVLNMFIKNISIEWSRCFPKSAICGYHPGTVVTHLSEPFQKNIDPNKLFSPKQAADYLFIQIQKTTPAMSGDLFDWQGERIAF